MQNVTSITKKITAVGEFLSRMGNVSPNVARAIREGQISLRDASIYTARKIGENIQMELCEANDGKAVGFTNFDRRRLEANNFLMVTSIRLLTGLSDDAKTANFQPISGKMLNGELEIKIGTKVVVNSISLHEFNRKGDGQDGTPGEYRLESPVMIGPQTEVIPTLKLASPGDPKTCVRIEFHGVITAK